MSNHDFRRFVLVVLLLLGAGSPAFAEVEWRAGSVSCRVECISNPAASAVGSPFLWADVWSLGHFFTAGGRSRIVQVCVVAMCLALFIMLKKVNG
jgi:hypothetical protein